MTASPRFDATLRHNTIVNVLDGAFFGFAMGFASFATMIPLFVSQLTDSAILIGLIPAIHTLGWQLPQLLTARHVSRMQRFKPFVILMTVNERVPFLGLAGVAWFWMTDHPSLAVVMTFLMFVWQGFGAGFTANAWQNLIGKIIPGEVRGTFFGAQSAAANLLSSLGAIMAGLLLDRLPSPQDFTYSFLLCGGLLGISWIFLALTKESPRTVEIETEHQAPLWNTVVSILQTNLSFRWFLASRFVFQFGTMAFAFYTVYAVRQLGMSEITAGVLTSVLLITQVVANPLFGWVADRWSRKWVMALGAAAAFGSTALAWAAPSLSWFYPIIILEGLANTVFWTIGMTLSLEFGREEERPTYVGMANTLIAPGAILAPLLGGWLADRGGYPLTFAVAAGFSAFTTLLLVVFVRDPNRKAAES
jgi:MFS family permease